MTISCPSCGSSYRIDPATLGAGRRVRCAKCKTDWFAEGVATTPGASAPSAAFSTPEPIQGLEDAAAIDFHDADIPEDPIEATALPYRRAAGVKGRDPARSLRKRLSGSIRPVAIAGALAIVVCGALVGERTAIVRAAPSLASLYSAVGLPVNVRGLSIADVRSVEQIEDGVPLLIVTGQVSNLTSGPVDVPRLRLAITGGSDRELYAWTTVASRGTLGPGESAPFRARLASPPADGNGVEVRFLARHDLATTASR